jgi:hypothetical protein
MSIPCGTEGTCTSPEVCCFTKIAPYAHCIQPEDYANDGCETMPLTPSCLVPTDCTGGTVCCVQLAASSISCQPQALCPGDGKNTYLTCATDQDCPNQVSGSCAPVPLGTDAGVALNVCAP